MDVDVDVDVDVEDNIYQSFKAQHGVLCCPRDAAKPKMHYVCKGRQRANADSPAVYTIR